MNHFIDLFPLNSTLTKTTRPTEKDKAAPMPKPEPKLKPKYKSVHVGIVDSESD